MCLGVPGRVLSVEGRTAVVDFFGVRRETRLDVVDEPVAPGDYILNHVGFAIRRIPASEIEETLALYEQLLEEAGGDMMAEDVRGEIEATGSPAPGLGGALRDVGPGGAP
ncbi:MAG: HypC/HybG/HupF family hydrogenase formation chaperone [Gemmatimonadota bacterium]|nr:HypC/HybG/HupF family hydrogenase formation chaperone [Gemmatimonadota bacterium]